MITAASLEDIEKLKGRERALFPLSKVYEMGVLARERHDRSGTLHPSAVGMCARKGVYDLLGYETQQRFDANTLDLFEVGHKVHDIVQTTLREEVPKAIEELKNELRTWDLEGYSFRDEVGYDPETDELYKNYRIGGTTDGILEIWGKGWKQRGVLEIKSISRKGFEALTSISAKRDHLMQAHLYAYRFDCPIIWVLYFCKDNSKIRIYPVIFDEDIFHEAFERMEAQYIHAQNETLPEREESWFECKSCKFAHHCNPTILNRKRRSRAGIRSTRNRNS